MPRAPRRCAKPRCRNFNPCPTHPRGWAASKSTLPADWPRLREAVKTGSQQICGKNFWGLDTGLGCGRKNLQGAVDHIVNRAEGGGHGLDNLCFLCDDCHRLKTREEKRRGIRRRFQ